MRHSYLSCTRASLGARDFAGGVLGIFLVACGGSGPPASHSIANTPKKQPDPSTSDDALCKNPDVAAFYARHAKAFGSEAEARAQMPLTLAGTMTINGKSGRYVMSIDAKRSKTSFDIPGLSNAGGTDEQGDWQLGNSGGVLRLRPDETVDAGDWILRRTYLSSFQPARDHARCEGHAATRRLVVEYAIPELGNPILTFEWGSTELTKIEHTSASGGRTVVKIAWAPRVGAAASWPALSEERAAGPALRVVFDKSGPAAADAFALPAPRLAFSFPASGTVKVPMKLYGSEILVHFKIGGKDAVGLLDSGAGISVVEAGSKVAEQFKPELEFEGQSATQKVTFGIGTLSDVTIGGLGIKNLPGARVAIPMFNQFGPNRPDVVLGWSLFEGLAVKVDYAKSELTFAKSPDALHSANAVALPIRDLEDKFITTATVGESGHLVHDLFQIDTGNAEGFSLYSRWATAHGFPGDRPNVAVMGQFSAGPDVTSSWFFRTGTELGPVHADADLVEASESPDSGIIAGLIGNVVLSKCDSVVFDMANRKVWLEGACARTPTMSHTWWTLAEHADPADANHPWVVVSTAPKGSADAAGIMRGDRVLSVGGVEASLHFDFVSTFYKPLGTKIPVVVKRGAEKKSVMLLLADPI